MNRRIRKATRITALLCAATLMTGCTSEEVRESHDNLSKISFSWWGKDIRNEYTIAALKTFEEQNKEVFVVPEYSEFEGFKTRMDVEFYSDTEADVMQLNYGWLWEYSPDGEGFWDLRELSDYINLDSFEEQDLTCGTINGRLNALPTSFNCMTFYYNKSLYDKYGLSIPENWADLIEAAKVMKSDEVYPIALTTKSAWLSSAAFCEQTTGKPMFSESGEFQYTEEDIQLMLGFYYELLENKVTKLTRDFDRKDFEEGKIGGVVAWISDSEYYCSPAEEAGFNIVVGDYLQTKDSHAFGWYKKPTSLYAIKKTTKYPEQAAKLVDYLVNSEDMALLQGTEKGIPASKAAVETLESRDMLSGISYRANQKMTVTDTLGTMDPKMENADAINIFVSAAEELYYDRSGLEISARSAYNKIAQAYGIS